MLASVHAVHVSVHVYHVTRGQSAIIIFYRRRRDSVLLGIHEGLAKSEWHPGLRQINPPLLAATQHANVLGATRHPLRHTPRVLKRRATHHLIHSCSYEVIWR